MPRAHYVENVLGVSGSGALSLMAGATVHVYDAGTTTPIAQTIYDSDGGSGTLSNPLTSDANGKVEFWLDTPARVDLAMIKTGFTSQTRTVDVEDTPTQATTADLDLLAGFAAANGTDGQVATLSGGKLVPQAPGGGSGVPEVLLYADLVAAGDTTQHNYSISLSGGGDFNAQGTPVGSWTIDGNGNLVPPADGTYLAQWWVEAPQPTSGPLALELIVNSDSSAFLVNNAHAVLPPKNAGDTAHPGTAAAIALSQSVSGPDRSLGVVQLQHLDAGGDALPLKVWCLLRKLGA